MRQIEKAVGLSPFSFDQSTLIFLHIPKCGGNSFLAFLRAQLPPGAAVFDVNDLRDQPELLGKLVKYDVRIQEFVGLSEAERKAYVFIHGHMPFGLHRFIQGRDVRYVSMVREPVERLASLYWFARSVPAHYLHNLSTAMTLSEFACTDASFELDNEQTRLLCGRYDALNSPIEDRVTQQDCGQAIINAPAAENVTGILGRYAESIALVQRHFGFSETVIVKKNVTRIKAEKISTRARDIIAERNKYDMQLFDAVTRDFDRRIQR
jgi:hypothetical protein